MSLCSFLSFSGLVVLWHARTSRSVVVADATSGATGDPGPGFLTGLLLSYLLTHRRLTFLYTYLPKGGSQAQGATQSDQVAPRSRPARDRDGGARAPTDQRRRALKMRGAMIAPDGPAASTTFAEDYVFCPCTCIAECCIPSAICCAVPCFLQLHKTLKRRYGVCCVETKWKLLHNIQEWLLTHPTCGTQVARLCEY